MVGKTFFFCVAALSNLKECLILTILWSLWKEKNDMFCMLKRDVEELITVVITSTVKQMLITHKARISWDVCMNLIAGK